MRFKVPTDKILIVYDDLDTPLASVKLKEKGGHGGHNGIRSLGQHLKGNFPRIKIGKLSPTPTLAFRCMLSHFCSVECIFFIAIHLLA